MLSTALLVMLAQADAATSAEQAAASAERAAAAATKAADALDRLNGTPPAAPAPPDAPPPNPDAWNGLVGLGLISVTGNAQALNAVATGQLDKRWGPWGFAGRASGAYGQTLVASTGVSEVSSLRAALSLRGERAVSGFAGIFLLGGLETDHVQSIEIRGFTEVGAGITFLERKDEARERLYLRGDVGLRYGHETRFQYFGSMAGTALPSVMTLGPRIAAVFRIAPSARFRFTEEAEFLPNVVGPPRYRVNSTTKANARLTDGLSLAASLLVSYDSLPAPGKRETDVTVTLGLEAVF